MLRIRENALLDRRSWREDRKFRTNRENAIMPRMKRFIFTLCYLLGLPALFRFLHRNGLTIVLYHGVAPKLDQGIYNYRGKFISPKQFEAQLVYFRRHYTVLPLERALQNMREGTLAPRTLAITFDDGYRNFHDFAHPLLKKHGMLATMFVTTDFVMRNEPLWVDRLEYAIGRSDGSRAEKIAHDTETRARFKTLAPATREHDLRNVEQTSWTQFNDFAGDRDVYAPLTKAHMSSMQLDGIAFGAHTRSHPILSTLSSDEQKSEIEGSREDLLQAGLRVSPVFAYPNGQRGDWSNETTAILERTGFSHALTTIEGVNTARTHRYELRRMVLDGTEKMTVFANVVSGVRLFLRSIL